FEELSRFTDLEQLSLNDCWPKDSVAPLARLVNLRQLRADAPGGWRELRACTRLRDVAAIKGRITNLHLFASWSDLRRLTFTGSGVRSFAGMEAFARLERLHAAMVLENAP